MDVKINFFEILCSLITQASLQASSSKKAIKNTVQNFTLKNKNKNNLTKQAKARKKMVRQIIADLSPVLEKLHDYDTKN